MGPEGIPPTNVAGDLRLRESLGDLSDLMLVARAQRGEERAFEAIMRRYNRKLFRIARGVLRDDSAAEDAVQEAYLSAFTHLNRYQPTGRFSAWLARIALNEALMLRRRVRLDTVSLEHIEAVCRGGKDVSPYVESALGDDALTSDGTDALQARQLLERAVDGLPDDFRLVFILRRVEQMSAAETAASLGIHEGTVRSRLHRAQRLLRADLSRRMQREQLNLFDFGGSQCDRIVAAVLERLKGLNLLRAPTPNLKEIAP